MVVSGVVGLRESSEAGVRVELRVGKSGRKGGREGWKEGWKGRVEGRVVMGLVGVGGE